MGILHSYIAEEERFALNPETENLNSKGYKKKLFTLMNEIKDGEESQDLFGQKEDWPTGYGPDGIPLCRNVSQFLTSFFIYKVAWSFTDIQNFYSQDKSKTELAK